MKHIRQILSVTVYDFRKWHKNPRIYITFILAFILCFLLSDKAVQFARMYETSMQIAEPFIWTFGDANSILLSSLLLLLIGGGMIAKFVDVLRAEYNRMPDAALQPMVDWVNAMLPAAGQSPIQGMTVTSFRYQLSGVLDLMQQTYAEIVPGALLSGAILSGILSVLWANWTMARRGMASNESFIGMSGWFLPSQLTLGAVGLWAVGLILMATGSANGTTVYMTIAQSVGALFAVQALCALDRRLLRADRPLNRRRLLIGLLAVAAMLLRGLGSALAYIGAASALAGSHGAIRQWTRNRPKDPPDDGMDE